MITDVAIEVLKDTRNEIIVSMVSMWEIAIKASIGKLPGLQKGVAPLFDYAIANGFSLIGINRQYIEAVQVLPFIHRDPFDRLLVAAAIEDDMTIITADKNIQKYDVKWVW
jgi:PIN domain nuclease of toxin-antitoxin system